MKADLTRETFRRDQRYSRVLQQQGRVPLDADWNEQSAIQQHHDETEARDVIGQAGFPAGESFHLTASADGLDLLIGDGTGYVDGILAENDNDGVDVLALPAANQIRLRTLILDELPLRVGEWVSLTDATHTTPQLARIQSLAPSTQTLTLTASLTAGLTAATARLKRVASYITQPDWYLPDDVTVPAAPALPKLNRDGTYVAYLDVWRRHVTALEDPLLREVALGGPDTCTREKTVWQVKLQPIAQGQPSDCTAALPTEPSTGRLSARARQPAAGDTPCVIEPSARYRSLENQLYRLEIHDPGPVGTATFKLSRDNGMVMVSWLGSSGGDLTVSSLGRDSVLGFASGQWIELVDDAVEESGKPGTLIQIKKVEPATNTITVDTTTSYPPNSYDIGAFPLHPRIRRWDQVSTTATLPVTRPAGDGFVDLEQGVQVRFEDGYYASGDYWLIPARTLTADVEWPRNELGDPLPQERRGINHHFGRLGVVTIAGGLITGVIDCRAQFPPLTGLTGGGGDAGCCCGIAIQPTQDPQTMIDNALAQLGSGSANGLTVEFAAGTFNLQAPLRIAAPADGGGPLVVRGCGRATRLVAAGSENVLRIVGWDSATVSDLYAEAGATGTGAGKHKRPDQEPPAAADANRHLLGAVYIRNCTVSRVERVELKCAPAATRQASCLMIWSDRASPYVLAATTAALSTQATVKDSVFHVGHFQVGLLLVNQSRATVQDNVVDSYRLSEIVVGKLTSSPAYLARYRNMIVRDVVVAQAGSEHGAVDGLSNQGLTVGNSRLLFRSDASLGSAWNNVLRSAGTTAFRALAKAPALQARELVKTQQPAGQQPTAQQPAPQQPAPQQPAPQQPTAQQPAAQQPAPQPPTVQQQPMQRLAIPEQPVTPQQPQASPSAPSAGTPSPATGTTTPRLLLQATQVTAKGTTRALQKQTLAASTRLNKMAYTILNAAANSGATKTTLSPSQLKPFADWLATQRTSFTAVASAGIVIAGQLGDELRVLDNSISNALDGIHLGFSEAGPKAPTDSAGRVQIVGNSIATAITADVQHGVHHGIFVGNANSVAIERNRVAVRFLGKVRPVVDGVSMWGTAGQSVIVAQNDVTAATVGVRMILRPLNDFHFWLAQNNATFGCASHIVAVPQVTQTANMPP